MLLRFPSPSTALQIFAFLIGIPDEMGEGGVKWERGGENELVADFHQHIVLLVVRPLLVAHAPKRYALIRNNGRNSMGFVQTTPVETCILV
jgi:hypothetical protein